MCDTENVKDPTLLTAKPLRRTPVSYVPTNEPITEDVLRDVAKQLGPEASQLAAALGISRPRVQIIQRNAFLRGSPAVVVNFEVLMMWVKALPKCADKYEQLSEALAACGRDDIISFIYDVKQKFEPGTKTIASTQVEENGKISRGVMAMPRKR